jgi:hypothetical protein
MRWLMALVTAGIASGLLGAGPGAFAAPVDAARPPSARPPGRPSGPIEPPRPTGRRGWRVDVGLAARGPGQEYTLRASRDPWARFRFRFRLEDVRVVVTDTKGRPVKTTARFVPAPGTPAVLQSVQESEDSPVHAASFVMQFQRNDLEAGMYQFRVSFPVVVTDLDTGEEVRVPLARSFSYPTYLPPEPDRLPSLTAGQQFFCLPEPGEELPYRDAAGRPIPRRQIALRVLTLERVERRAGQKPLLTFGLERFSGKVQLASDGGVTSLPQLYPLVEDDHLRHLRAKYEGKRVWPYGAFQASCITDNALVSGNLGLDHATTFVPRRLVRLYGTSFTMTIGSAPGVVGGLGNSEFQARNPLVVVLGEPQQFQTTGMAWSGVSAEDLSDPETSLPDRCIGFYHTFSNAWDLERTYSLVPASQAHPEWPAAIHRAVKEGDLQKGMTPDMVAWSMGWPSEYGTIEEMRQWKNWRYDGPPPFSFWVRFRNGRVANWGHDGRLP